MTAICQGGTSSKRPEFASAVSVGVPAIAALLNNIPTAWAVGFAAAIGLLNYNLDQYCANDPPAVPDNITAADVEAMLSFQRDPVAFDAARGKLQQLVGAYNWYRFCKCDTVATPAPPPPPPAPAGSPTQLPPSVVACRHVEEIGANGRDVSPGFEYFVTGSQALLGTNATLLVAQLFGTSVSGTGRVLASLLLLGAP